MRILFVPHVYAPVVGGAQHYCRRVAETLAEGGHDVRVVTADLASAEGYYRFDVGTTGRGDEDMAGVKVERIPLPALAYRTGGAVGREPTPHNAAQRVAMTLARRGFRRRLAARIRSIAPEAVVTLPHLFVNVRAVLALRRVDRFPLVLVPVLHEFDPNWPVDEMRAAVAAADAVVALTEDERQRLVTTYGASPGRVVVAPPGVDPPEPEPELRVARDQVVYLGRLAPSKGLDLLRAAIGLVWKRRPDVKLVLAGTPEPEWDDSAWHGSPARILERPSEAEKWELLATSQCLVMPSRNEAFGLVVLEAWAAGRPVIALDLPVFSETIRHEEDGILVTPDSPATFATAIERLLRDDRAADAMGRAGHSRVVADFSWAHTAASVEDAIHRATTHQGRLGPGLSTDG